MTLKEYNEMCGKAFRMRAKDFFFAGLRDYVVKVRTALVKELGSPEKMSRIDQERSLPPKAEKIAQEMKQYIESY